MKWILDCVGGIALFLTGLYMATFGAFSCVQDAYFAYQSKEWPKASALILSKNIEKYYSGSKGEISYHYEVGGHSYFGQWHSVNSKYISVDELASQWTDYVIGGELIVSYQLENPKLAFRSDEQNNWGLRLFKLFILGPGGLLITGFGFVIAQNGFGYKSLTIKRPRSDYRNPMSRKKRKASPGRMPNRS